MGNFQIGSLVSLNPEMGYSESQCKKVYVVDELEGDGLLNVVPIPKDGTCITKEKKHFRLLAIRPKMIVVVRTDLNMPKGKIGSQVAHASKSFMRKRSHIDKENGTMIIKNLTPIQMEWLDDGLSTTVVCKVSTETELRQLYFKVANAGIEVCMFHDAGLTMFDGKTTLTAIAIGPDLSENLDSLTNHLKLL
jgi:peptidyl-tRNA hydrolase, PTH2 family